MRKVRNEIEKPRDTSNMTPIESALQMDESGMTSAKALYEYLELNPGNYARWCKSNIENNRFAEENADYRAFFMQEEWGGQATTDYKLSISFAKKLAMQSGSPKGEVARQYFITCEKKLAEVAQERNTHNAVIDSTFLFQIAETVKQQEERIKELEPKAAYADTLTSATNAVPIKELSLYLCKSGVIIGRNRLFELMREDGYLCKDGAARNMPTQYAIDNEWLIARQGSYIKNGEVQTSTTPYVTARGKEYFLRKYGKQPSFELSPVF